MSARKSRSNTGVKTPSSKSKEVLLIVIVIIIMMKVGLFTEHMRSSLMRALFSFIIVIIQLFSPFYTCGQ